MSILEELIYVLNEASGKDTISLYEKIMTKAQARKQKLRAKRRAAKKAEKRAAKKNLKNQDTTTTENNLSLPQETNNTEEENTSQKTNNTALIRYQPIQQEEYTQISEEFTNFINKIGTLLQQFKKEMSESIDSWRRAGINSPCPPEVWEELNKNISLFSENVQKLGQALDLEKLAEPELLIVQAQLQGITTFIDRGQKFITSIKPNLSPKDLQKFIDAEDKNLELPDNQKTLLLTNKKKKEIITFKKAEKSLDALEAKGIDKLIAYNLQIKERITLGIKAIWEAGKKATEFIGSFVEEFINIPVVKDFIKVIMSANPITKMIFDQEFGTLKTLKHYLGKIGEHIKNSIDKELNKVEYDNLKLPKTLEGLTFNDLKREFYGNINFVSLVNNSFNNDRVRVEDKALLKKYVDKIDKAFISKNTEEVISNFYNLLKTCRNICTYMNWKSPIAWNKLLNYKQVRGNTSTEREKIDNLSKKSSQTNKLNQIVHTLRNEGKLSDSQIKTNLLAKGYSEKTIDKALEESFIFITDLQKLLEEAER